MDNTALDRSKTIDESFQIIPLVCSGIIRMIYFLPDDPLTNSALPREVAISDQSEGYMARKVTYMIATVLMDVSCRINRMAGFFPHCPMIPSANG